MKKIIPLITLGAIILFWLAGLYNPSSIQLWSSNIFPLASNYIIVIPFLLCLIAAPIIVCGLVTENTLFITEVTVLALLNPLIIYAFYFPETNTIKLLFILTLTFAIIFLTVELLILRVHSFLLIFRFILIIFCGIILILFLKANLSVFNLETYKVSKLNFSYFEADWIKYWQEPGVIIVGLAMFVVTSLKNLVQFLNKSNSSLKFLAIITVIFGSLIIYLPILQGKLIPEYNKYEKPEYYDSTVVELRGRLSKGNILIVDSQSEVEAPEFSLNFEETFEGLNAHIISRESKENIDLYTLVKEEFLSNEVTPQLLRKFSISQIVLIDLERNNLDIYNLKNKLDSSFLLKSSINSNEDSIFQVYINDKFEEKTYKSIPKLKTSIINAEHSLQGNTLISTFESKEESKFSYTAGLQLLIKSNKDNLDAKLTTIPSEVKVKYLSKTILEVLENYQLSQRSEYVVYTDKIIEHIKSKSIDESLNFFNSEIVRLFGKYDETDVLDLAKFNLLRDCTVETNLLPFGSEIEGDKKSCYILGNLNIESRAEVLLMLDTDLTMLNGDYEICIYDESSKKCIAKSVNGQIQPLLLSPTNNRKLQVRISTFPTNRGLYKLKINLLKISEFELLKGFDLTNKQKAQEIKLIPNKPVEIATSVLPVVIDKKELTNCSFVPFARFSNKVELTSAGVSVLEKREWCLEHELENSNYNLICVDSTCYQNDAAEINDKNFRIVGKKLLIFGNNKSNTVNEEIELVNSGQRVFLSD